MLPPFLLGVIMGAVTSYTDVKTGFIDDVHVFPALSLIEMLRGRYSPEGTLEKIPIPAVEFGIAYYAYRGLSSGNTLLAVAGVAGFLLGLALGLALYYLGGWASGDVLILAGFSALLPFPPEGVKYVPPYYGNYPFYPVTLLLNSILAIFPFIFAYALAVVFTKKKFKELREIFVSGTDTTLELTLWVLASFVGVLLIERLGYRPGTVAEWLIAIAIITVLGARRKVGDVIGIIALAYLIYLNPVEGISITLKTFVLLYTFKVFLVLVKFIRTEVLIEEVGVEELREWDILGETVFEKNGKVMRDRLDSFTRLKLAFLKGNPSLLRPDYGRVIASPSAEGLSKNQIEELRVLVEEGKLENRFLRKKSMPFAPALFLGFLISYFFGDVFWWIELKMMGL
ncbi:A24 family peptidase C-terminal domain-containing protein [Thermococcus sp.]|uniref:A24 family peptidase C-terminal domain-containing protein n=1 Tax=Thermococcus sp. TaxID=35749 RepID=UPI003416C342